MSCTGRGQKRREDWFLVIHFMLFVYHSVSMTPDEYKCVMNEYGYTVIEDEFLGVRYLHSYGPSGTDYIVFRRNDLEKMNQVKLVSLVLERIFTLTHP
jgi:hypothetical protein